jgi:hypothetical protein
MRRIGRIQLVQIQRESLKVDEGSTRYYDPTPLLTVARLQLTSDGVYGIADDGTAIVDVHNTQHPRSRNRADNFISMGFTGHYAAMRARMGDHLTDGIAGENMTVVYDGILTPEQLGKEVFIETQNGERIALDAVLPIPPCEPFSRYAANRSLTAPEMKATLQFLSDGTRGFYMRIADAESAFVQAGDTVWAAD